MYVCMYVCMFVCMYVCMNTKLTILADIHPTPCSFEPPTAMHNVLQRSGNDPRAPVVPSSKSEVQWGTHSASDVYNMWRAFGTKPGVRTTFKGKVVRLLTLSRVLHDAEESDSNESESEHECNERDNECSAAPDYQDLEPGTIVVDSREPAKSRGRGGLFVVCQDKQVVRVTALQFEAKRAVEAKDFYNGHLGKMPTDQWRFV
jgi:methionyl-tRNA formyltransferase